MRVALGHYERSLIAKQTLLDPVEACLGLVCLKRRFVGS